MKTAREILEAEMSEEEIQIQLCDYIRLHYPGVVFNSDGAGNNVSPARAAINTRLRSSSGYPDIFVAAPRGRFHGAFWELKKIGATLYLKNGNLSPNDHVQEQAEVIQALIKAGYYAQFAQGLSDAIRQLDWYMSL